MTIVTTAHMHTIDPSVTRRQRVEQRIASRAVSALLKAGYWLAVCQGDEDEQLASRNKRDVMKLLGDCDDDRIIVYDGKTHLRAGWLYLVYGNDGNDVIADYSCTLEKQLAAVNAYAETLV